MKRLLWLFSLSALVLSGCKDEAERFGYVGRDLQADEPLFFARGGGVTNWVPSRVIRVSEQYEFSAAETNLVRCLGLVNSGETLKALPAGYAKRETGPWFDFYVKDVTAFGRKGVTGFLCHYDPDARVWETGETFFSTYHGSIDAARESLKLMEADIARECKPLKFHRFSDAVVAEYRRLRVVCVAGPRAGGDYACMVSVVDKNREGCGEWADDQEQQEMLDSYLFSKAVAAWNAACGRISAANHEAVEKARVQRGLDCFGAGSKTVWAKGGNGGFCAAQEEGLDLKKGDPRLETLMADRMALVAKSFGVRFGDVVTNACDQSVLDLSAVATNDLFDVRLGVCVTDPPPVMVRLEVAERLQPGFVMPPYPTFPKH